MPAEPVPFDLRSAREAFATTGRLQAEATRLGAPRLGPEDFDRLRAADAAYVDALEAGRVEEAIAADDAFHQVLLDAAADPDLQVSLDLLLPRLKRMDLYVFARKTLERSESSHPAIMAALESGDAEGAARLVENSYAAAGAALAAAVERER
jgi:DNA-binding GntR family transcriptional regulator